MFVIMEHSCYYSFKEKCFCNVFFKCWNSTPTHVYADVLVPIVGELLLVKPEPMNDKKAVAILKLGVYHMPQKLAFLQNLVLREHLQ